MATMTAVDSLRTILAHLDSTDPYYVNNRERLYLYAMALADYDKTGEAAREWAAYVPIWEREVAVKSATWSGEYRARKTHTCVRRDPYCPGEVRPGELYARTATLVRAPGERGTVIVSKACMACRNLI